MAFYLHNFYLALNLAVFRLVKFLVLTLGARVLAPAAFGYFSYLYSLMDIWNHVFGAGLDIRAARSRAAGAPLPLPEARDPWSPAGTLGPAGLSSPWNSIGPKSLTWDPRPPKLCGGPASLAGGKGPLESQRDEGSDGSSVPRSSAEGGCVAGASGPQVWPSIATGRFFLGLAGAAAGLAIFQWPYNLIFALWHVFFLQSRLAYSFVNTLLYPRGIVMAGLASQAALAAGAYYGLKFLGLAGFVAAFALERLIEGVFLFRAAARLEPSLVTQLPGAFHSRLWLSSLRQWMTKEGGKTIWIGQLLGVLSARLDTVLVQVLLGYSALASYSLAFRTCEAPLFLFAAMAETSLAYFVRHPQERSQLWKQSLKMALLAGFGLALLVSLFGLLAAPWVFGPQYQDIGSLIAVCSWVLIPRGLNMVSSSFLLASGGEKILLLSSASGMAFGLLANIALIPWFGVWAPAVVAIAAETVTAWLRYHLVRSAHS